MNLPTYLLRKLVAAVPLMLGVTLLSFTLMVHFGPDLAQQLVGRNATAEELAAARHSLGYDQPFLVRYLQYLRELVTLDFGASASTGEPVTGILLRSLPVTLALVTPGFVLGNLFGLASALLAALHRERWLDRVITATAIAAMSISFLIVVIVCQLAFSSSEGLGLFPVRGWRVDDLPSYLHHVAVPTLALTIATWGFNTRFYRAVLVEEMDHDYVRTSLAFGAPRGTLLVGDVLRNAAIPIATRVLFSIPLIVLSGSLVLEQYFGIPGVGEVTYTAVTSGNQPVLKAVVALSALVFILMQTLADGLYALLDPRVTHA